MIKNRREQKSTLRRYNLKKQWKKIEKGFGICLLINNKWLTKAFFWFILNLPAESRQTSELTEKELQLPFLKSCKVWRRNNFLNPKIAFVIKKKDFFDLLKKEGATTFMLETNMKEDTSTFKIKTKKKEGASTFTVKTKKKEGASTFMFKTKMKEGASIMLPLSYKAKMIFCQLYTKKSDNI